MNWIQRFDDSRLIALDADGVLLDYNLAYASAWALAFGELPPERNRKAYWAADRWDVHKLHGKELEHFRSCFDQVFWATIPAADGALEACQILSDAGFRLVCVTALPQEFRTARQCNLRSLGFPIEEVFTVDHTEGDLSPKLKTLGDLKPLAFVDDYLPYFKGVLGPVHRALIARDPHGSPNHGPGLAEVQSTHPSLLDFSRWWTSSNGERF